MDIDVTNLHGRRAVNRWERLSVGDIFERLTWSLPEKVAIIGWEGACADPQFERVTYAQADTIANRIANGLLEKGLARGDRVLLFCENSVEAYLAKIGIAKAGLVAVPLNPALSSDVISYILERISPTFTFCDAELWARAEESFTARGLDVDVTITIGGGAIKGSTTFSEFVNSHDSAEPEVEIHGDDIWQILFTSGTTAMPKGVMISHSMSTLAAYSFALSMTRGLHLENELRIASFLPIIYHIADQIFTFSAFQAGGSLVIGRRPMAAAIATAIATERVTGLWAGSPAMVNAVADVLEGELSDLDVTSLTTLSYGWAALPPKTLASLKRRCGERLVAFEIFGQTESISCHRFWPDAWPEIYQRTAPEHNYVGLPNPLLASMVMDAEGENLAGKPYTAGEAVYRSPAISSGYYLDEGATRDAFRDGWFHSGDSCVYDENGLRIMVDRFKDIVKSGGENVSTIRVESVLHLHPSVMKAAVIGVRDERWGEAVTAIVVPKEHATLTEAELIAFCRERLAGFETPKSIVFVDSLPETIGGKVLKYRLREQYAKR